MSPITGFEKKLRLIFGFLLAIILAAIAVSFRTIDSLTDNGYWVNHTNEVIVQLDEAMIDFNEVRHGLKAYLLTGQERYLGPIESSRRRIDESLAAIKALTEDNAVQQDSHARLVARVHAYLEIETEIIRMARVEGMEAAIEPIGRGETDRASRAVRWTVDEMVAHERNLLVIREANRRVAVTQAYGILPSLLGVDMLLVITMYSIVMKEKSHAPQ